MSKLCIEAPTLSPDAGTAVRRIIRHLDSNPEAGVFVVLFERTPEGSRVETFGANISRHGVKAGAELLCEDVIDALRACECGKNHDAEIAEMEQAKLLLSGEYSRQVRQ